MIEREEYNFSKIQGNFGLVMRDIFKQDMPSAEELMRLTDRDMTGALKSITYESGVYTLPKNTSVGTALAVLILIALENKIAPFLVLIKKYNKLLPILQRGNKLKTLLNFAKINFAMFRHNSLKEKQTNINFAVGLASYLFFSKFFVDSKRNKQLSYNAIYNFFDVSFGGKLPKLGFSIPSSIATDNPEETEDINDLPNTPMQEMLSLNNFYSEGGKPTAEVEKANLEMINLLNRGQGLDAIFKKLDLNIITIEHNIEDQYLSKLINGEGYIENDNYVESPYPEGDIEDKNIILKLGPIKRAERVLEKLTMWFGNDASQLTDLVRCTFICKNKAQLEKFNKLFYNLMYKNGAKLASRPKDRLTNPLPSGYGDIINYFILPNGFVIEVQTSILKLMEVKEIAHEIYEKERSIDLRLEPHRKEEKEYYSAQQRKLYNGVRQELELPLVVERTPNKNASSEVKFFDVYGMPCLKNSLGIYYIYAYDGKLKEVKDESMVLNNGLCLTRVQFVELFKKFKETLLLKGIHILK